MGSNMLSSQIIGKSVKTLNFFFFQIGPKPLTGIWSWNICGDAGRRFISNQKMYWWRTCSHVIRYSGTFSLSSTRNQELCSWKKKINQHWQTFQNLIYKFHINNASAKMVGYNKPLLCIDGTKKHKHSILNHMCRWNMRMCCSNMHGIDSGQHYPIFL